MVAGVADGDGGTVGGEALGDTAADANVAAQDDEVAVFLRELRASNLAAFEERLATAKRFG
ncbi:hypothetical protein AMK19_14355 [Kitasatospora sp. CB01950]|nr:hypothetical protein AMK19_14355 [Kitasatospora sp. CB01950]